ncbi:MAG: flavodoxin family protein [Chloroflexi bacterium]|nr:flavodoxin family protein [Chloroflexota bacterium]
MNKIRILGIAGSPRHGNTEVGVKEALAGAAELPDVETEFYTMAGKKINPCSCPVAWRCWTEGTPENPCPRWGNDDVAQLYKKMQTFDGFIVGSPVYMGGVSSQIKALWDRLALICYRRMTLRNKVVGGIAIAAYRSGGQEQTILEIWKMAVVIDLIPVGPGPVMQDRVCMWGGALTHEYGAHKYASDYPVGAEEELTAVEQDEPGLLSCRMTGRRVAEVARVVQAGFSAVPREATYWPAGEAGGFPETDWKIVTV